MLLDVLFGGDTHSLPILLFFPLLLFPLIYVVVEQGLQLIGHKMPAPKGKIWKWIFLFACLLYLPYCFILFIFIVEFLPYLLALIGHFPLNLDLSFIFGCVIWVAMALVKQVYRSHDTPF